MKAIALISGGLDSCVAVAVAREEGYGVRRALSIEYGQRHVKELSSAIKVAEHYRLEHHVMVVNIAAQIQESSALLNVREELPHDRALSAMTARVPRSYVPGRNTIMLALAQSIAEAYDVDYIITGFNAVDFSGYPDCRPIFVEAWNHLAQYSTRRGYQDHNPIQVYAPIINKSKASIVAIGTALKVPFHLTWSCYEGGKTACGRCDSCRIRLDAIKENNLEDPIEYTK